MVSGSQGGPLSRRKKFVFTLVLLTLVFAALEIGLRGYWRTRQAISDEPQPKIITNRATLYRPHPFLTYALNPDKPEFNEQGLRDTRNFEPNFEGTRIACLGGSSTYGTHVRPWRSYPAQLEMQLKQGGNGPVQVINAGAPGYTTFHLTGLLSFRILDFHPDIVLFYTGFNDAWNRLYFPHFRGDGSNAMKAWEWNGSGPAWWQASAVLDGAARLTGYSDAPHIHKICWHAKKGEPEVNWADSSSDAFRRNLKTLISISRGHGSLPVFSTQATDFENHPVKGLERIWPVAIAEMTSVLREVTTEEQVHLIDLATVMDNTESYFDDCLHMTEEGNRVRAGIIADYLRERGLLRGDSHDETGPGDR